MSNFCVRFEARWGQMFCKLPPVIAVTVLCAVSLWAAPAAAVPGLVFVSSVPTVTDSSSTKTATINCPAGKKVYSAGGSIQIVSGASGRVVLTAVFPSPTLDSVTAIAAEDAAGFSGTWRMHAQAICGNPVANMQRVKASSSTAAFDANLATATCPASTVLYGTGFAIQGAPGRVFIEQLSRANSTNHLVEGLARVDDSGLAIPWSIDVLAICGAAAPGYEIMSQQGVQDSVSPKTNILSCPPPKKVHGMGFRIVPNGAEGDVAMTGWQYDTQATRGVGLVHENDPTIQVWRINVNVTCAN